MLPKWTEDYSIGNAHIDEQHKKLFDLAGELEVVIDRSVNRQKIKNMLTEFFHYMRDHFRDEETYMREVKYPEFEAHRRIHKDIVEDMIHLIGSIKTTNDLKERLYHISKKWLLQHILYEDMKIAEFVKSQVALEGGDGRTKEISYIDADIETHGYYYTCGCKDKTHDVPEEVHNQISLQVKEVRCRVCNEAIVFLKKDEGE